MGLIKWQLFGDLDVNQTGSVLVTADRVGADSLLAQIVALGA